MLTSVWLPKSCISFNFKILHSPWFSSSNHLKKTIWLMCSCWLWNWVQSMANIQITKTIQFARKISPFKFVSQLYFTMNISSHAFSGLWFLLFLSPLTSQGILYWMVNTLGWKYRDNRCCQYSWSPQSNFVPQWFCCTLCPFLELIYQCIVYAV